MNRDPDVHPQRGAPPAAGGGDPEALAALGWGPFFARQTDAEALVETPPVRVVAVHRSGLQVVGAAIDQALPPRPDATVGDWLLLDRAQPGPRGSVPIF